MKTIRVCAGPHCNYRKSKGIMDALQNFVNEQKMTDADLGYCACVGFCEEGPNVVVNDELLYRHADAQTIGDEVKADTGKKLSDLNAEAAVDLDELIKDF